MKKTGWIFRMKKTGLYSTGYGYIKWDIPIPTSEHLTKALVVSSRKYARLVKNINETILQAELDSKGKAIKIIGRG